jgi:DNA-binding NarL/FixJ family response regulator
VIGIFVADDHPIVRQGLHALLEAEGGFQIVGEAGDGLTAVALITQLRPDLAILDVRLPDLGGLEVARRVHEQMPNVRVIMLSMFGDEPYVLEALRHGASAYVLKSSTTIDLVAAVHAAMEGPAISQRATD